MTADRHRIAQAVQDILDNLDHLSVFALRAADDGILRRFQNVTLHWHELAAHEVERRAKKGS
jgi:hypothetical protein